jgi:hypothetical protein
MLSGTRFGPEVFLFYSTIRREYKMKKGSVYAALALLAALLVLAGCEGPAGPQGAEGNRGLNPWEGPFSFSVNNGESSEPLTDLAEFSAALKEALAALPGDAGTDPDDPVKLKVNGLTLSETEHLYVLYGAMSRYVDLDLSGCKGTMVAATVININYNTAGSPLSPALFQENKTNIVSLILPDSVAALEHLLLLRPDGAYFYYGAFQDFPELKAVTMRGVTVIGNNSFSNCLALETVECPDLVSIGKEGFFSTSLTTLNFPKLESIGESAFSGCQFLETVDFPALASAGSYAFVSCTALREARLPILVSAGSGVFSGCASLTELDLPLLEAVPDTAFSGCQLLTELRLPALRSAGTQAFGSCRSLVTIELPVVESIGIYAFTACSSLKEVSLPTLSSFGSSTFNFCTSLTTITLGVVPPATVGTNIFSNTSLTTITFKVPEGSKTTYETTWDTVNAAKLGGTGITRSYVGIPE